MVDPLVHSGCRTSLISSSETWPLILLSGSLKSTGLLRHVKKFTWHARLGKAQGGDTNWNLEMLSFLF